MKNKLFSIFTALAMVLGILVSPFTSAHAADEKEVTETNTVTVHKLMMTPELLKDWDSNAVEKGTPGTDGKANGYDGSQNLDQLNAILKNMQKTEVSEIKDVYFALKFNNTQKVFEEDQVTIDENTKAGTIKDNEEPVDATKGAYVMAGVDNKTPLTVTRKEGQAPNDKDVTYLVSTTNPNKAVAGLTTATGITFNTKALKGDFEFEEVISKSTYKKADGSVITGTKAVPILITLPLVNSNGVVTDAHVYPKNTEDKPKIDKNFKKDNTLKEANGDFSENLTEEEKTMADQTGTIQEGPNYDNYAKKKKIANAELGKNIPYEVKTEIPANSNLQLAKWDDKMTDGLTYNKDLTIKIGDTTLTKNTEYEISETDSGFVLRLTEAGLKLVNGQDAAVTVMLSYSATVNKDAIIDVPEKNDVKFHYGNNPSKENDPKPGKPNTNGELKVKKTWDDGVWAKGESATFELRDAETGRKVTADELVKPDNMSDTDWENTKKQFNAEVTIGYPGKDADGKPVSKESAVWKYLNKDKNYIAVEIKSTTPSDVEYVEGEDGTLKATNHISTNPTPLNPTSPKVVTGGKKFVKTDQKGKRLAGAEFYVKNSAGKYLVLKDALTKEANVVKSAEASAKYKKAIEDYNDASEKEGADDNNVQITVDGTAITGKTEILKKIDELYKEYEKAFKESAKKYDWEDTNANAYVLVSDSEGRFEIKDLEYAKDYELEEKSAPKGYAKLNSTVKFDVEKGSYSTKDVNIKYNQEDNDKSAKQIENKKVSIPQTGGIGSLIFVVAGLAIMAGAYVAYRKNQARA